MGPPRHYKSNMTAEDGDGSLLAAQSRLSHTHARLLSALDALDSLRTSHHKEMSALAQQKRSQTAKLRVYEERMQILEAERDDMRHAVEQLIDQVERSNSYGAWPCSRMKISGVYAEPSRIAAIPLNPDPSISDFTAQLVNTLRAQLATERASHEQAKLRIAELEAKVARREAEIERLLMSHPGSHSQQAPLQGEAVIDVLDANVRRNRMLEAEIKELSAKLENKRTEPILQPETEDHSATLCAPLGGNSSGVHGTVVRLTKELEQLSAAIDGLQGVRTDIRVRGNKGRTTNTGKDAGPNKSLAAGVKPGMTSNGASDPTSQPSSIEKEVSSPKTSPVAQQPLAPAPLVAPSPLRSSPNTSNVDWTGLRTPEPTVTMTLGSPVTLESRPLRSVANDASTHPTSPQLSDDDGERSMELATPLPSSSIVTMGRDNITPGRISRSRSNTPRRPRSRLRSPGTPSSSMELATPLPSTSIVTSHIRSRSDNSNNHTPHRARAMTWSNPPSPSPSHHSALYSQGVSISQPSPGTPTPLSRSQTSNSEISLTRSIRLDNTMSPDSRPPSELRLSPQFIPLPSSSDENTDSIRSNRADRSNISISSASEWEEGHEDENSFEREYSRERRHLQQNENEARHSGKRRQVPSSSSSSKNDTERLRIDLNEAKGRLMDGERALGELKDVFEGLRKVLVTHSSPRSQRHSSTSTGASSSSR